MLQFGGMNGGINMAANRWLTILLRFSALLAGVGLTGAGHPTVAEAAEVQRVRAALHNDSAQTPATEPQSRTRIVFDLQNVRPGSNEAADLRPERSADGLEWTLVLGAPLSARAEAQLRALPRRIPGLDIRLVREDSPPMCKVTLRFDKPTMLARQFVLPGRTGQQERLVLDFTPDAGPVPAMVVASQAQAVPAPSGLTALMPAAFPAAAPDPSAASRPHILPLSAPATLAQNTALPPGASGQAEPARAGTGEQGGDKQNPDAQNPDVQGPDVQGPEERAPGRARPQAEPAGAMPLQRDDELPPPPTGESPLTLWGFFEAEGRWFPQDSRDGAPDHLIGSMAMEPTVEYSWKGGSQFLRFTGFARVDTVTENRTHADVREAKYVGVFGPLEMTVGVDRRFWGVTEAVHLVNIINQVDTLEDVDFEDYLGQPLISAAYTTRFGTFSAFLMPYFRERLFPTGEDRPNLPVKINRTLTQYESGNNNWHPDWALRWSLREGPVDLGLSYFSGFSRDPQLLLSFNSQGRPELIPRYNLIDQVGIDLQATLGSWLLKFEGIHRWDPVDDYAAFAAGFEYTFYGVSAAGADLGVLAEYLYDERGKGTPLAPGIPPFSNVSPYDDDVFVGFRWSGNDIASTEVLGGAIFDLDTKSKAFVIEASRRLGNNLRISLDGRFFSSISTRDVLWPAGDDDFIQLKLQWHY